MILRAIALIIRRNLAHHRASVLVTVMSLGLAGGLTMSIFSVEHQSREAFTMRDLGFDAVLGAKGSQLQLVLNAIFHLAVSPGNIHWSEYQKLLDDDRVELAIPYALGDNFEGYRLVGTETKIFTKFEFNSGKKLTVRPGGRAFHPEYKEAVLGSFVAQQTGLGVGDEFQAAHGVLPSDNAHIHEDGYLVTGVLEPTNTPLDKIILIPIEAVFHEHGHVLRGSGTEFDPEPGEEIPEEHLEVSAIVMKLADPQAGFTLHQEYNLRDSDATFAWPVGRVVAQIFKDLGWMHTVLTAVAWLTLVVASASIFAGIYSSLNERRRNFAIIRSLGARRQVLFGALMGEAIMIAVFSVALSYVVFACLMVVAARIVRSETGIVLEVASFHWALILVPAAMIGLAALAGLVPALKAYRSDVAQNLSPMT